jgi:hypothetical protein
MKRSSTHEVHDLDLIALANDDMLKGVALQDRQVVFHSDPARIDREPRQQIGDRERLIELERIAVQNDTHRI